MQRDPEVETDQPGWEAPPQAHSLFQVVWHRKAFVLLGAFVGLVAAFLWHLQRSPVYQSSCQLLVIQKQRNPLDPADPNKQFYEDYMPSQLALLRSPLILERAVAKRELTALKTFENVGNPVGMIRANLGAARDIKETGGVPSNIIVLSLRGPVAEDTGKILQAVLDSYQEYLDVTYRNVSDKTLELIKKARDELLQDLHAAEAKQTQFRNNSGSPWTNKEGIALEQQRVSTIEADITKLQLKKTVLRDRIAAMEKALAEGKGMDLLAALRKGETTADGKSLADEKYVKEPLMQLILKKQELLEDYGPEHPQVKSIDNRIATMRDYLSKLIPEASEKDPAKRALAAMKLELSETEQQLTASGEIVEKLKKDARALLNYEVEENHLRNDVTRLQLIYDATVKRLQQISLVRETPGGIDAQPLSRPEAGAKIAPVAYQDLGLGLIAGLLLGAGLAYLAELSDKSFRNPAEIRNRLGLPLVGHIPFLAPDPDAERKRTAGETCPDPLLCTYYRPKSLEAEAYRAVRTALFFAAQSVGHKVIQVTSPNKSDGKSLMIANLAVMVAQSGKSVLLIDADLRRPRQHRMFGLEAPVGLAKVLAGEVEPPDAIVATGVPGLSILPCGTVPPNPSELLTSPRFNELLETVRGQYDFVLVDTPPLLAVTDPCVVAGRVDGVFLTIRLTRKGRPDAERAREILAGLNVKIIGVVVNGLARGAGGIYSPHHYDYTESYDQDEANGEEDYYYYEEDNKPNDDAPVAIGQAANGTNGTNGTNGAPEPSGKSLWRRWWPGS